MCLSLDHLRERNESLQKELVRLRQTHVDEMEATVKYQQERSATQLAMAEERCHNSILELKRVQQRYSETERDCEVLRGRDVHRDNEIRELRRINGGLREEMERETKRMSAAVVAHQDEMYALQQTHQAEVKEVQPYPTLYVANPH